MSKNCILFATLLSLLACGGETEKQAETTTESAAVSGEALYGDYCATCHEGGVAKAPHKMFLEMMPTQSIIAAMESGIMQQQSVALNADQRQAVAEYLTGVSLADSLNQPQPRACDSRIDHAAGIAAMGWGFDSMNTRFQPESSGGLTGADLENLELAWVFAYPGAQRARSQPAVIGNTVYVGSQDGTLYALDLASGCVHWQTNVGAEIRTAIVASDGEQPVIYFGDLLARAYAVDATNGSILWRHKVDEHPNATITGTPSIADGKLLVPVSSLEVTSAAAPDYPCCSFRGSVLALSLTDGAEIWRTYTIPQAPQKHAETSVGTPILGPSGAPIWNSPTVDLKRGRLYVGTGENYSSPADENSDAIIAIDIADGERLWTYQATTGDAWNVACMLEDKSNCPEEDGPDYDFGSSSILIESEAGDVLVAGQKSGAVHALDPDTGELLWRKRLGRGGIQGGIHFGMAADGPTLYVPMSDFDDGQQHDMEARPGIYAVSARDGELLWSMPADDVCNGREFCQPGISAAITAIPGAVIAGHMDGRLRSYAKDDGRILWEYDTARRFDEEAGMPAFGGSMGGAGAVAANGYLLTNSGYGIYFHMPGNVLLAFKPSTDE